MTHQWRQHGIAGTVFFGSMAFALAISLATPARAVVTFFDGFGDADMDNNGMPLELQDVNVQGSLANTTYVPGRLAGGEEPPVNHEVTEVLDPSDVGIRWLSIRGFTGGNDTAGLPGPNESKPTIRIVDDSQGAMQETKPIGVEGGLGITAIDSGYAMSWESRGGGSVAAGFFDQRISLGSEVGDEVKVSFDFRIWRDAPNLNGSLPDNVPFHGELRFGLYQDTDNQLGMTNPFAGRQRDEEGNPTTDLLPAVWGVEEGLFEGLTTGKHGTGDDVGTHGDHGWNASVFMGESILPNGGGSRIREEVQSDRILQGNDMQTIKAPVNLNPDPFGTPIYDFVSLDLDKVYNVALSLKRAVFNGDLDSYSSIEATLTITDKATQEVWTLTGIEDDFEDESPFAGGGIQSDSWDYFAIRNATSGTGAGSGGEFDFIMDNFMLEVIGSSAVLDGDFNNNGAVENADLTLLLNNWGAAVPPVPAGWTGHQPTVPAIDNDELTALLNNWGNAAGGGSLSPSAQGVPEPAAGFLAFVGGLLAAATRRRNG